MHFFQNSHLSQGLCTCHPPLVFVKSWSESHCCRATREDSFSDIFLVVNPTTFIAGRKLRQNNDQNNCQSNYQLAITQQVPASLSHCHRVIEIWIRILQEHLSGNFTTRSLVYQITSVVYWTHRLCWQRTSLSIPLHFAEVDKFGSKWSVLNSFLRNRCKISQNFSKHQKMAFKV